MLCPMLQLTSAVRFPPVANLKAVLIVHLGSHLTHRSLLSLSVDSLPAVPGVGHWLHRISGLATPIDTSRKNVRNLLNLLDVG